MTTATERETVSNSSATTATETRSPHRLTTVDFWAELIIKQGVSAAIAIYLVWQISSQQQSAILRLERSVQEIGAKLDRVADRLPVR